MRAIRTLLTGATAIALFLAPVSMGPLPVALGVDTAQAATPNVSINIFFQPLASHGVWVKSSKYHYVFCPKVDAHWRPYTHGRWIYMKKYGWYFASDEPYAWAVYHYGRWYADRKLGWCWVPGNAWAGAWVSWRRGNDYIGWAPLEPTREGFAVDVDISTQEPPQHDWVFVQPKRFLEPKLDVEIVFGDKQPDVFQKTQYAGPVIVQNNIVVNNVIDVNFIQQQTNTKVVEVEPKPVNDPQQASADASGTTVAVFAPQIPPPKQDEAPDQSVDENQAQDQLGNNGASSAPASSDQTSSALSSSEAPSGASSSEAASSMASSEVSSSSITSSSASSSAESPASSSSSSAAPAPTSSTEPSAMSSVSSAQEISSSAEPASSTEPASSSEPASSKELASSSEPASSKEPAPSKEKPSSSEVAPVSSSAEPVSEAPSSEQASSEQQQPSSTAPAQCDDGYVLVKGKCVPAEGASSAAQ